MVLSLSEVLSYLVEAGGKTNILTEDGETALDLVDCDDLETLAVLLNTKVANLRKKMSLTAGPLKSQPAWVRKESRQEELEKKKISCSVIQPVIQPVIANKYKEISVCQTVQKRDVEMVPAVPASTAPTTDPVKSDQTERKRRIGQAEALSSFVNSKLSQKDSKDRI